MAQGPEDTKKWAEFIGPDPTNAPTDCHTCKNVIEFGNHHCLDDGCPWCKDCWENAKRIDNGKVS